MVEHGDQAGHVAARSCAVNLGEQHVVTTSLRYVCSNFGPAPGRSEIGAGEGNRTLVVSLEGFCSTIELHPPDETIFRIRAHPFALEVAVVEEVGFEPT